MNLNFITSNQLGLMHIAKWIAFETLNVTLSNMNARNFKREPNSRKSNKEREMKVLFWGTMLGSEPTKLPLWKPGRLFFFSFPIVGVPSISDIVYLIPPPNWKYAFTLIVTPTFVLKLNFAQISFATFFLYHMGPNQLYSHADMTICDWSTSYRAKAEKQNFS